LVVCPRCSSKMRVLAVITNCCRSEKDPAPTDQDRLPSSGLGSRAAELIVQSIYPTWAVVPAEGEP
jgi:hypothetical protein